MLSGDEEDYPSSSHEDHGRPGSSSLGETGSAERPGCHVARGRQGTAHRKDSGSCPADRYIKAGIVWGIDKKIT